MKKEVKHNLSAKKSTKKNDDFLESAPPMTPEEWESRLIASSYAAVEERIKNGTASAAELTYFLRAGSTKQRQEIEKLREENALLRARTSAIESEKDKSVFYREVIASLGTYRTETTDDPTDPFVY